MSGPISHTTDLPLPEARALIDRAIDKAEEIAMRGAVAVIGASGALVSASRMDHGGAGAWREPAPRRGSPLPSRCAAPST
jgi:uncharacterized protein GlcG (DUF336 family)